MIYVYDVREDAFNRHVRECITKLNAAVDSGLDTHEGTLLLGRAISAATLADGTPFPTYQQTRLSGGLLELLSEIIWFARWDLHVRARAPKN